MIRVYGASDDLIEIDGDIEEEFNADFEEDKRYIVFSDGTIIEAKYDDDGCWRFKKLVDGKSFVTIIYTGVPDGVTTSEELPDGCPPYSDCVEISESISDPIRWVVLGNSLIRRKTQK